MKCPNSISELLGKFVPADSLRARLAAGMMWVTGASLSRQGVNFITGIVAARIIGVKDFGKLAVIQTTILMLAELGQAGIGFSTTKYVASTRSIDPIKTGRIIGFALVFTLLCAVFMGVNVYLFSSTISSVVLQNQNLANGIRLASVWIVFEMINMLQTRVLNGFEAFRSSAIYSANQAILQLPLTMIGAYHGGLIGIIMAFSAVSIIGCVVGQLVLRKVCRLHQIPISYRDVWQERGILRMSAMVGISGIATNVTNWLVGIMLARQPNGLSEFGVFNAAIRFQNILLFLPTRIFDVTVPVLANLQTQNDRRGFAKALMGMGLFTVTVTSSAAFLIYLFADQLMKWYGAEFAAGAGVLSIVVFGAVVSAIWTVATAGLWAAERSTEMLILDVIRGSLLLGLCLAGFAISARNLALAYLYSYGLGVILVLIVLVRFIRRPWTSKIIVDPSA